MKLRPLVSIIMPAFNEEQHISAAVKSVLSQTYGNWELLVIDDGSQDKTSDILYGFDDSRIFLDKQAQNRGVSNARNIGLENAKGEYLVFLDADDILPVKSLESRLEIFSSRPNTTFVDGKVVTFNADMTSALDVWTPQYQGHPFQRLLGLDGSCFYGLTWMIKRNTLSKVNFSIDMTHGEDLFYLMQISQGDELQYAFTTEEILYRRTGHGSAMNDLSGLEDGYRQLCTRIQDLESVSHEQIRYFKRRARSIMIKSYLGKLDVKQAMNTLGTKW